MAWDPDSGDPLESPAVRVGDVERSSNTIWAEFLGGWFNGVTHQLRGVDCRTVPVILTFQEMAIVKPMDGLYLTIVLDDRRTSMGRRFTRDQWELYSDVYLYFYFRAFVKLARNDGHNSISLTRWGADTLYSILTSSLHCAALQRVGITQLRPNPPRLFGGVSNPMREVCVESRYVYPANETIVEPIPVYD